MRILVVQESNWIDRGPHQSHHLMERLSQRGHEVKVIDFDILWRKKPRTRLVSTREVFECVHKATMDGGVTVIRPSIMRLPILEYISLLFTHWREVKRQISELRPDVIVAFGILNSSIARHQANKAGIPFVCYVIDELHRLVPQQLLRGVAKWIETNNLRKSEMVVSINEGLREYTIGMGADPARTCVIRAGVELSRYDSKTDVMATRRQLRIKDDAIVLFFMGWLYEFSGIKEVALELAKRKDMRNTLLLVVGKGDLWEPLQEIRSKLSLDDQLLLIQWVSYDKIPSYIIASDVCLLPSLMVDIMKNIVPIKMYEYMAAGKPVICTTLPGLVKEFGVDNGVVYVGGPDEVLDTVKRLAENHAFVTLGEQARRFVDKNDWNAVTVEFERALRKRIDTRKG